MLSQVGQETLQEFSLFVGSCLMASCGKDPAILVFQIGKPKSIEEKSFQYFACWHLVAKIRVIKTSQTLLLPLVIQQTEEWCYPPWGGGASAPLQHRAVPWNGPVPKTKVCACSRHEPSQCTSFSSVSETGSCFGLPLSIQVTPALQALSVLLPTWGTDCDPSEGSLHFRGMPAASLLWKAASEHACWLSPKGLCKHCESLMQPQSHRLKKGKEKLP